MKQIIIANSNISIKEFKGQRVVTLNDIDIVHNRPNGTARRNFNVNKSRFIEGEDFFKVCANEIRTHKIMSISNKVREDVTLLTESGYLMLVKSFTDDLSWTVQRELVNSYFRIKDLVPTTSDYNCYTYIPKTYHGRPILTVNDISHLYNINTNTLHTHIKNKLVPDRDYKLLQGYEVAEYNKENSSLSNHCRKSVFVIFNTGLTRLISYYKLDESKTPSFMITHKGYVVNCGVQSLMEYIRREIKGVEALTYLLESDDSPHNLENYRKLLTNKLSAINWWKTDVENVSLDIRRITVPQLQAIHRGEYGIK